MNPINWKMIGHPMNWIVVLLMLILAGTAGHLLLSLLGHEPASQNVSPNAGVGQTFAGNNVAVNQ